MQLPEMPFTELDWSKIPALDYPGEVGMSRWQVIEAGGLRIRIVDYGPGFVADHWCDRGHVFQVLSGEVTIELADGRRFDLSDGQGFAVSDYGDAAHLVRTVSGARVFIVD